MTTREEMLDAGERDRAARLRKKNGLTLFQHIKRGSVYRVLHQDVIREHDMVSLVVYQEIGGAGTIWARPTVEFFDPTRFRVCPENMELDSRMPSAHDEDRTEF